MRISDWSSDVCSSDLELVGRHVAQRRGVLDGLQQLVAVLLERLPRPIALRRAEHVAGAQVAVDQVQQVGGRRGADGFPGVVAKIPGFGRQFACAVEIHAARSEEHTSELQSLMRISYAVFCM